MIKRIKTIQECYDAYRNGDTLSDKELAYFTNHMAVTTESLTALGPEFKIAANHCREIARQCHNYTTARCQRM